MTSLSVMIQVRGALAITLLVGLAGCSSGGHPASTPTTRPVPSTARPSTVTTSPLPFDVPWIDRPAPRFVSLSRPLPPDNARPCTSTDVHGRAEASEGVNSTAVFVEYEFMNKSRTTCALGGFPTTVLATEPDLTPVVAEHTRLSEHLPPGNVAPGKSGFLNVYSSSCGGSVPSPSSTLPRRVYHHLVVSMPGGGQAVVQSDLDLSCGGFSIDPLGVRQPPIHAWYSLLMMNISVPASVNAGGTLTYVVTLTNPTTTPARINPCPGYIETATGRGINIVQTHALNCDRMHKIPASGRVRYQMRMRIPNNTRSGAAVVSWTLDGPESPIGGAKLLNIRSSATTSR